MSACLAIFTRECCVVYEFTTNCLLIPTSRCWTFLCTAGVSNLACKFPSSTRGTSMGLQVPSLQSGPVRSPLSRVTRIREVRTPHANDMRLIFCSRRTKINVQAPPHTRFTRSDSSRGAVAAHFEDVDAQRHTLQANGPLRVLVGVGAMMRAGAGQGCTRRAREARFAELEAVGADVERQTLWPLQVQLNRK